MLFTKPIVFIFFAVFCFSYMAFSAELSMREASNTNDPSQLKKATFNINDSSQPKNAEKSIAQEEHPFTEKEYYEILNSSTPPSYGDFKRVLEFMNINSFKEYMEWFNSIEFEFEIFPISPKKFYGEEWEGWPNGHLRNHKIDKAMQLALEKAIELEINEIRALENGEIVSFYNNLPLEQHTLLPKTHNKKTKRSFINRKKKWMEFAEAQAHVQEVGIQSSTEFREWSKAGKRPFNLPSAPDVRYKKEWVSWYHFLGTKGKRRVVKKWMEFAEAQAHVQEVGIQSSTEFREWSKSGKRPFNLPSAPAVKYKKEWKGWPHFLGTKGKRRVVKKKRRVVKKKRRVVKKWMSLAEAQAHVQEVGIKTQSELREWSKSGKRPLNFPSDPDVKYKKEWVSWPHFLGTAKCKKAFK